MDLCQDRKVNQAAFQRLKDVIARTYPPGRFVAITGGQIIADADGFREICSILKTEGKDPVHTLIVQAGVDYPEKGVIFQGEAV